MLSNHYRCAFDQGGKTFNSVEQCFMYHKAKEFGDEATAHAILCSEDLAHAKALGKKVQNFQAKQWNNVRNGKMKDALRAKFDQNEELKLFLKQTEETVLAEANPHDNYWGIGLSLEDKDTWDPDMWKGRNELGKLLMEVRNTLK